MKNTQKALKKVSVKSLDLYIRPSFILRKKKVGAFTFA